MDTYASDPRMFGIKRFAIAARSLLRNRRNIDVVHVHLSERGSFIREGALVLLASILKLRTVVTLHGADFVEFMGTHARLVRAVLRRADDIAVLTAPTERVLRSSGFANVTRVPNAVSIEQPDATNPAPVPTHEVVYAGVVAARKGADVLFEAWAGVLQHHPEARLHVFGEIVDVTPPDEPTIEIHGKVSRARVRRSLERATLFTLPSRAEAFPMAILEAMAAGLPVVATDVGEISEMLNDSAQIIPAGDAARLTSALTRFLGDADRAASTGNRNANRYRTKYSPSVVMDQYEALYRA
ncbi:glycosyltransferase family 4 protein [Microbacterium faecale]|uniref:glycosyltransferase family 4 protein n=1 Tax=Microbacterium faecale TaxID=1804630 RepID=UPI003570B4AD